MTKEKIDLLGNQYIKDLIADLVRDIKSLETKQKESLRIITEELNNSKYGTYAQVQLYINNQISLNNLEVTRDSIEALDRIENLDDLNIILEEVDKLKTKYESDLNALNTRKEKVDLFTKEYITITIKIETSKSTINLYDSIVKYLNSVKDIHKEQINKLSEEPVSMTEFEEAEVVSEEEDSLGNPSLSKETKVTNKTTSTKKSTDKKTSIDK